MLLNCGVGEDSWESLGLQGDPTSPFWRRSALGRNDAKAETLVLWPPHAKSWLIGKDSELGAGGEGDDRGWDGWMASLSRWTWVWVNLGSWWWTGRPGMLRFMGSQRVGNDWVTEVNWTELKHLENTKLWWDSVMWAWTILEKIRPGFVLKFPLSKPYISAKHAWVFIFQSRKKVRRHEVTLLIGIV